MKQQLAKEFTSLVDWSVTELGLVIKNELGDAGFNRIEKIRRYVKSDLTNDIHRLQKLKLDLKKTSADEQFQIAHSFALMLELINACETAYRSFRLSQKKTAVMEESKNRGRVIHVLTAHPTESRNPDIIYFFTKIQDLLIQRLDQPKAQQAQKLHSLLRMAWNLPTSKQRKPSVMDEAEYIYSLVLQQNVIELFIQNHQARQPFYIRTWVGGDKDGHPKVDEKTMLGSLKMSRGFFLKWLLQELNLYFDDLQPLARSGLHNRDFIRALVVQSKKAKTHLSKLKAISPGDAKRVHTLLTSINLLSENHRQLFGVDSEQLFRILTLFKVFPGLVVPLELRETSALVHEALNKPVKAMNISRMLQALADLCTDHNPRNYVRGFVLSQCESASDITAGVKLSERLCGARLPIVPLFESAHSLENASQIVNEFLSVKKHLTIIKKNWSKQFEVMLGYSDSAKENGSFPSRYLIHHAIADLEKQISKHNLIPIFFHGSGGSIERGGGSIQEQTEWWPNSALATVKMTIQGEMIYRNYNSELILQRQLNLLAENRIERQQKPVPHQSQRCRILLNELSQGIQTSYQQILSDPRFLELIEKATPYSFLKDLRFGSRPAKRPGPVQLENLRAIPWVLCWTQTRVLFPSWWGIGSFWSTLTAEQKKGYQSAFKESAVFRSYIKALGFTLKKIEMEVFFLYLENSKLPQPVVEEFEKLFKQEYKKALRCMKEITTENNLLWYRPWLGRSIELRSPLIHPLNVLQLIALETKDIKLLRETVTGIASGMLTTG